MPNWCFNTLTIQDHSADTINDIKNRLNTPFVRSHDNWNTETQKMEIKEYGYSNPVFAFWNIVKPDNLDTYIKQPDHSLPLAEAMQFKSDDWYSWNNRNWGTKWDVAVSDDNKYPDTQLLEHESNGADQWLVYSFNTAWAPPISAIEKLSELYPTTVITLSYEEETGWGGEYEFVNGEMTAESNYENKCRDCDSEDTLEYCDTCDIEVCSDCHDMNEANPDDVKECEEHREFANAN